VSLSIFGCAKISAEKWKLKNGVTMRKKSFRKKKVGTGIDDCSNGRHQKKEDWVEKKRLAKRAKIAHL